MSRSRNRMRKLSKRRRRQVKKHPHGRRDPKLPVSAEARARDKKPCHYCRRHMDVTTKHLYPTRDHLYAKPVSTSQELRQRIVWCCWSCNQIKGDMTPAAWQAVLGIFPVPAKAFSRKWMKGARFQMHLWREGFPVPHPLTSLAEVGGTG